MLPSSKQRIGYGWLGTTTSVDRNAVGTTQAIALPWTIAIVAGYCGVRDAFADLGRGCI